MKIVGYLILIIGSDRPSRTGKNHQIIRTDEKYLLFALFFKKAASHSPPVRFARPAYATHLGLGHTPRM